METSKIFPVICYIWFVSICVYIYLLHFYITKYISHCHITLQCAHTVLYRSQSPSPILIGLVIHFIEMLYAYHKLYIIL